MITNVAPLMLQLDPTA